MTVLFRFATAAAILLLAAVGWVQSRQAARTRAELAVQSTTASDLEHQIRQSRGETAQFLKLMPVERSAPPEAVDLNPASGSVDPAEVGEWLKRVKQLRQAFADQPRQRIPQLALLTDQEWVAIARAAQLDTDDGINHALADARTAAKNRFVSSLWSAMESYLDAHHGSLPPDLDALLPTLADRANQPDTRSHASAADPTILAQYELTATGKFSDAPTGVLVKEKALLDEELDHRIELERDEDGLALSETSTSVETTDDDDDGTFERSVRAFAAAHQGAGPEKPTDLLPFLEGSITQNIAETVARHPMTPEELKLFKKYTTGLLSKPVDP